MARPMDVEELVQVLRVEHEAVRGTLQRLETALEKKRYTEAARLVPDLCDDLRQHILDEEATLLKAIIDARGRVGASESIKVVQEHRAVHGLIGEMEKLAASTPGMLPAKVAALRTTLEAHIAAEEKTLFPQALDARRARTR